jgi:hypothetical protein
MKKIYKETSEHLNLPIEVVKAAYESFYKFIRETIKEIPLKDSDINIKDLKTSFNIPSIGKLYCNEKKLEKIKSKYDKSCRRH